jgi:DNA-binding NarL/FixJ family response regulator
VIAADVTRQPQDAALAVAIAADSPADEHRLHQVLSVTGRCTVHRLAAPGDDLGNRRGLPADGADVIVLWRRVAATELAAELQGYRDDQDAPAVIAVLGHTHVTSMRRLLRAGANGLLLDSQLEGSLDVTFAAVSAGMLVVPPGFRPRVDRQPLSHREKQVLGMVVLGFTNRQIADKLFLAESTIKTHLSSAFSKLNTRSRAEATALILDPEEGLGSGILALIDNQPAGS